MRTTIEIDETLLRMAKERAEDENCTLREVMDRALRQYLSGGGNVKFKLNWKPHKGGHLQPGVVLEDRDSLFDLMDGRR
jgi:hypothetical protein